MEKLYGIYNELLGLTDTRFVRYLHDRMHWDVDLAFRGFTN